MSRARRKLTVALPIALGVAAPVGVARRPARRARWQRSGSDPDDFKAAQKVFSDAAPKLLAAANANDVNAVKSTYGELGKACKNCHDTFRAPDDHDH